MSSPGIPDRDPVSVSNRNKKSMYLIGSMTFVTDNVSVIVEYHKKEIVSLLHYTVQSKLHIPLSSMTSLRQCMEKGTGYIRQDTETADIWECPF